MMQPALCIAVVLIYPSLLMCRARLDLMFAALFLWIMFVFDNLSNIFCTLGYNFTASSLSVRARNLRTALRIVFA